jgi:hypothetical protein
MVKVVKTRGQFASLHIRISLNTFPGFAWTPFIKAAGSQPPSIVVHANSENVSTDKKKGIKLNNKYCIRSEILETLGC